LACDYRYTGQREEDAIGLYYYDVRWYDPALGRFIQPDTIVPGASNTQALNRYSYVLNNPMKYTDPTGHWTPEEDPSDTRYYTRQYGAVGVSNTRSKSASVLRKMALQHVALGLRGVTNQTTSDLLSGRGYLSAGHLTAADAMMIVLRKAERMSQGNTRIFAEDTNAVLSGHNIDFLAYYRNRADGGVDNPGKSSPDYYATFVGSTGFASEYQDPNWENEQTHHFWFYVQLTYEYGPFWGMGGNIYHELTDRDLNGRSWQDLALGVEGITVGLMCRDSRNTPEDINDYIEKHVVRP
jgi:RHS repeat-associated protein